MILFILAQARQKYLLEKAMTPSYNKTIWQTNN